jgi:hypothetical protein
LARAVHIAVSAGHRPVAIMLCSLKPWEVRDGF